MRPEHHTVGFFGRRLLTVSVSPRVEWNPAHTCAQLLEGSELRLLALERKIAATERGTAIG
jgi:hypothetical protein